MSSPPTRDPDPLDRAVAAFRAMPTPDRPADAEVLSRLTQPPVTVRTPWRTIMRRSALFATAASVAVAVGVLLVGGNSVALADVVKAAEKHTLVKYKRTQTAVDPHSKEDVHQVAVCYDDLRAARHRSDVRILALNELVDSVHTHVSDAVKDRELIVLSETIRDIKQPDKSQQQILNAIIGKFPRQLATLRQPSVPAPGQPKPAAQKPLLATLRELEANPKSVAVKDVTAIRYRLEDGTKTTQLWVDPATRLPVKVQYELLLPMQNERLTWVYDDFEWDPKLPAGVKSADELFSVTPPAGYELTDETAKK